MKQIEFEQKLANCDAKYIKLKKEKENEIRNVKMKLNLLEKSYRDSVAREKQYILELENEISVLKAERAVERAALHNDFLEPEKAEETN